MKKNCPSGSCQRNSTSLQYINWLVVVCSLYIFHSGSPAACQDSPKEFYPKGFVQQSSSPKSPSNTLTQTLSTEQLNKQPATKTTSNQRQNFENQPTHQLRDSNGGSSQTATEVSVFVNSLDPAHLNRVIAKVLSLQSRGKIHFGAVMHMGNPHNVASQQEKALEAQGIMLMSIFELPTNLPITRSPAWVVTEVGPNDEKHARLVEGYFDIEQFFDQYGHFAIPAGIEVERAGKKADEKLEGF
jgi:hypothetical protein